MKSLEVHEEMRTGVTETLGRKQRGEPTSAAIRSLRMGLCSDERLLVGTRESSRAFGGNLRMPDLMA